MSTVHLRRPKAIIVVALSLESDGVFEAAGLPVLYSGVGKVNATHALTYALAGYSLRNEELPLVVNFGTVGSRRLPAGSLVSCSEFVQRDMDVSGLGFDLGVTPYDSTPARLKFDPLFNALPQAVCGTGDSFATDEFTMACDVVDMEAFALAKVCWMEKARFACAKYVTDGADGEAAADWKRNVHKAAEQFLQLFRGIQ